MIDFDTQLKIQAFLDGELVGSEQRDIAALIARDGEAAALHAELKNTRRALAADGQGIVLPESRELYWGRICRQIERNQPSRDDVPSVFIPAWHLFLRWVSPVGVVGAVLILGMVVWMQTAPAGNNGVFTAQLDDDTITFQDDATGTTFVWLDYPPENGFASDGKATTLD